MATRTRKLTAADRRAVQKVQTLWADFQKKNPGITQEVAAARAGMGQSAFSQFLLGKIPMRVSPTLKFAKLFGVAPSEIRDDIAEHGAYSIPALAAPPKVAEPAPGDLSAHALEVARVFTKLSPPTQDFFRELLFIYAAIDKHYPWLRKGRPKGESYEKYEERIGQNFAAMLVLQKARNP